MADIAYRRPTIQSRATNANLQTLLGGQIGYTEASNVLYDNSFVTLVSGALRSSIAVSTGVVASDANTRFAGFVPKSESGQTALNPPYSMWGTQISGSYQPRYFPHALRGMRFAIWVTDASFNIGSPSGPLLSEVVIGQSYGLVVGGTTTPGGAYAGGYAMNVDDTTDPDVTVVDIPTIWAGVPQPTTVFNGIVIVQFIESKIIAIE